MPPKGKNPNMARFEGENAKWKGGKSSDYRRRVTKAKPGEIVHHKDHNKANNSKANFKIIKPTDGMDAIGKHNQAHPEKGTKGAKAMHAKAGKK